jgi:hypothetical protein
MLQRGPVIREQGMRVPIGIRPGALDRYEINLCGSWGTVWHQIDRG